MISPARRQSFDLLCQIELGGAFSDDAINRPEVSRLDLRDRNLVTEIVFGTLRWRLFLDHHLAEVSLRTWNEVHPAVKILLRLSLYQMWFMDRIPDHALVHDAVEIAKQEFHRTGSSGFVNGVLRRLGRQRRRLNQDNDRGVAPWIRASLPEWLWNRWKGRYGENQAMDFALSLNKPPRCALRLVESAKCNVSLPAGAVPSELVPGVFFSDEFPKSAGIRVQDEASQLIPLLLGEVSGWRVWDSCAAPGGKSALLAERCGESGRVISSDRSLRRAKRLARSLAASSADTANVLVADAAAPPPFQTQFDAVLADVPCSGLGTLRRNPEIKWRFQPEKLSLQQRSQTMILNSVYHAVRSGGLLLYSTCSTEPEENEHVVDVFLAAHGNFRLIRPNFPPDLERWIDARGLLRTYPSNRLWDGFFAAIMLRVS